MPLKDKKKLKEYLQSEKRKETNRKTHEKYKEEYALKSKEHTEKNKIKNMDWLLKYLNLDKIPCAKCGYNKCFAAIDCHHLNPQQKKNNSDTFCHWVCKSLAYFKKKILNTSFIFLCKNCHTELHEELKGK
jgi:hypothetical protein